MLNPYRFLERVKARRDDSIPARLALRSVLSLWKAARRVPILNRARLTLRADGHRMRVRLFSYDDLLTVSQDYEPCMRRLAIRPGAIVVDAGAFLGRHTLEFARRVGPTGRVIAVEPLASNFSVLKQNVIKNGYRNVTCLRCALGDRDGEVTLSYGRETSIASTTGKGRYRQRAPQRSLDGLLQELGIARVDWLKVDVEGAELDVLRGAEGVLAASPGIQLAIEVHGKCDEDSSGPKQLRDWLRTRGYSIREVEEAGRRFFFTHHEPGPSRPNPQSSSSFAHGRPHALHPSMVLPETK